MELCGQLLSAGVTGEHHRELWRNIHRSVAGDVVNHFVLGCMRRLPLIVFALLSVGSSSLFPANLTEGDNALLFDDVSGLQWLRLDATFHLNATGIYSQLAPGGRFHGFRFASILEVQSLFAHAGIPATSSDGLFVVDSVNGSILLQQLVGYWTSPTGSVSAGFVDDIAQNPLLYGSVSGVFPHGNALMRVHRIVTGDLHWGDSDLRVPTRTVVELKTKQSAGSTLVCFNITLFSYFEPGQRVVPTHTDHDRFAR